MPEPAGKTLPLLLLLTQVSRHRPARDEREFYELSHLTCEVEFFFFLLLHSLGYRKKRHEGWSGSFVFGFRKTLLQLTCPPRVGRGIRCGHQPLGAIFAGQTCVCDGFCGQKCDIDDKLWSAMWRALYESCIVNILKMLQMSSYIVKSSNKSIFEHAQFSQMTWIDFKLTVFEFLEMSSMIYNVLKFTSSRMSFIRQTVFKRHWMFYLKYLKNPATVFKWYSWTTLECPKCLKFMQIPSNV